MSFFEKIIGETGGKKAFRAYRKRGEALKKEYQVVWNEIERYFFTCGPMDCALDILIDIVALFETGAAEGKYVLDITGHDVIAFCDEMILAYKGRTWLDQFRIKSNERIHKKLEDLKSEHDCGTVPLL